MINLSTNKQFDITVANTNKALAEIIKSASPKELEQLSQHKDLKSLLNSLLTQSLQNPQSDKLLLELLKNNPTLKNLSNISDSIKDLLSLIKSDKTLLALEKTLQNSLLDIGKFTKSAIKQKLENSGVFLESKLKDGVNMKEVISSDLKAILLKASDEISKSARPNQTELLKQIEKLTLTIDYHQLLSHLSNSSSIYLPFSWEQLENGNINIKKDKEDKFYCDIELKLKEYGELTLKLVLYDKNQLNIHIYSDNFKFKELIKEHVGTLRTALIDAQITPREIRLFDTNKNSSTSPYENNFNHIEIGFEVKV
ncbi:MAG: flagellar hook-length control protein FliK [Campylobacterota bacterium]|nr:flagellar hook-length control protein FliK [Campylobacterota bacterium]